MARHIILASASPRRQQLLSILGVEFTVEPSFIEEKMDTTLDFGELVGSMALQKARAVAKKHDEGLIIGADTIVVLGKDILGKPKTPEKARKMLFALSGKWHKVYTGIAIIDINSNKYIVDFEESKVKFKELNELEVEHYLDTGEPMDKAGSYGIQGKGALLIEKIEGCYYNIVGLPLYKLNLMLRDFDIEIL